VWAVRTIGALAGVPLSFAAGGLLARAVLQAAPARIAADLAQPVAVVTGWGAFGGALWAVLAGTMLTAALCAWAVVRMLRVAPLPSGAGLAVLILTAAGALAAALTWPVIFSSDIYAYATYGEQALRGIDPAAHASHGDGGALAAASAWQWNGTVPVCVYGAAFVALARGIVGATSWAGPAATLMAFRAVACAGYLGACVALFFALPSVRAETRGGDGRLRSVAVLALNPVALWCAAEGHNDAVMLAAALVGAAVVKRWGAAFGGLVLGLSSALKAPGLAIGAATVAAASTSPRIGTRRAALALLCGLPVAAVLTAGPALEATRQLGRHGTYAPQFSLQALAVAGAHEVLPGGSSTVAGVAAALLVALALGAAGVAALRAGGLAGWAWLAAGVWLAIPNPYPWYALWILPIVAIVVDAGVFVALASATISIAVRYLPDAVGPLSPDRATMIALVELAPLVLLVAVVPKLARAGAPALP
jgi:hypothetical protein